MWEGWNKCVDTEDAKYYSLLSGSEVKVLLGAYLTRREAAPIVWHVLVNAFNPGAGEYILYENTFASYAEAELKAWEEAHAAE
jgi:hypothetical protein